MLGAILAEDEAGKPITLRTLLRIAAHPQNILVPTTLLQYLIGTTVANPSSKTYLIHHGAQVKTQGDERPEMLGVNDGGRFVGPRGIRVENSPRVPLVGETRP